MDNVIYQKYHAETHLDSNDTFGFINDTFGFINVTFGFINVTFGFINVTYSLPSTFAAGEV